MFHREWVKNTVVKSPDKIYEILCESGKTMTKHIDLVFVNTIQGYKLYKMAEQVKDTLAVWKVRSYNTSIYSELGITVTLFART